MRFGFNFGLFRKKYNVVIVTTNRLITEAGAFITAENGDYITW